MKDRVGPVGSVAQYPAAPGALVPSRRRRRRTPRYRESSVVPGLARARVLLWEFCSSTSSQIRSHVVPCDSESVNDARYSASESLYQ